MYLQKHTLQIAAISLILGGVFVMLGGERLPAYAQSGASSQTSLFSSTPLPSSANSSVPASQVSHTSRSFPSLSFSSISVSVGFSSQPISSTMSFSSFTVPSFSFSSFSFSQMSHSSVSISQFSRSSVSFSFSTSFSFQSSAVTSATSLSSGASQTSTSFTGSSGGTGGGGGFGGIIGGGAGTFGGGGTVTTGGGGGGSVAKPSADPAPPGTCKVTGVKGKFLKRTCLPLIQPLGSENRLDVKPGAQTFIDYFNEAVDLLLTIAVGFAVLWILIGSYFIMVSGSDGGKRSTGKSMITWALIGLIIVNFAGFFLRTMNSIFFT